MAYISMEVPVIVTQEDVGGFSEYILRPLFFLHPCVRARRFESAEQKFKKALVELLKPLSLDRDTLRSFLWYRFHPNMKYKVRYFQCNIGKQFVRGHFAYGIFEVEAQRFLYFPRLNNLMVMLPTEYRRDFEMDLYVEEVLLKFLRREKKHSFDNSLEIEDFFSSQSEFVSTVKVNLNIKSAPFPFEENNLNDFFAALRGQTKFDGEHELEKVGYNLNDNYPAELLSAWYREEIVASLRRIIFSTENTPIVLLGREGVGKKSVLHEALYRYIGDNPTDNVHTHQRMWYIDPTRIISGMSIVGMWQKRFEAILEYVMNRRQKINNRFKEKDIIFFDNVIALLRVGQSSQNKMSLSDVLKPFLEKRMLPVVLLATPEEWKIVQEEGRKFADLFRVIRVEEPSTHDAVKMVLQTRKLLEIEHNVGINTHAIQKLFTLQRNFFKSQALPGGVMKLLKQMAVKYKFNEITEEVVDKEFRDFSQLNFNITDDNTIFEKDTIKKNLSVKLVGQEDAVQALADTIHIIKAKIADPSKPKGSFLFIGPTGVGKTQAAKALADILRGDASQLIRFDMNEYIDEYAATRLIGDAHNPEGILTGKVRYNPFGIILLDEIEKAHPKIHDLLLQVLDDGRLTDSLGRTVDFSNTIIIMTSNVGANQVDSRVGFGHIPAEVDAVYRKAVENQFRPEFVNRIDKIVIFRPLKQEHILGIARLQINELLSRDGFVRRTTILNITEEALQWVSHRGFSESMGGRALKRQIEKDLTALSAEQLLESDGTSPVILDIALEEGKLAPNITTLEFIEPLESGWLPTMPDETKGRRSYHDLLKVVQKLEREISKSEQNANKEEDEIIVFDEHHRELNWEYYGFKERLAHIKEQINDTMIGFRDQHFRKGVATPLRFKGAKLKSFIGRTDNYSRAYINLMKQKVFMEEGLQELSEYYRLSSDFFDSFNSEFIDHFMDVVYIRIQTKGFLSGEIHPVRIELQSCIEGKGTEQIAYLQQHYTRFLEYLDIPYENISGNAIELNMYAGFEMFKGEEGIHLFSRSFETPLPIKVRVIQKDRPLDPDWKVIRVYDFAGGTLSDIRSDFSNAIQMTPQEFKLLLYAGWDEKFLI